MKEIEKLMQPRYRVIAPMPVLPFKLGEIYNADFVPVKVLGTETYVRLDLFPHLFKKLEWYEERLLGELLHVKYAKTIAGNSVRTVKEIQDYCGKIVLDGGKIRSIKQWLPATEQEYLSYQSHLTLTQTS